MVVVVVVVVVDCATWRFSIQVGFKKLKISNTIYWYNNSFWLITKDSHEEKVVYEAYISRTYEISTDHNKMKWLINLHQFWSLIPQLTYLSKSHWLVLYVASQTQLTVHWNNFNEFLNQHNYYSRKSRIIDYQLMKASCS